MRKIAFSIIFGGLLTLVYLAIKTAIDKNAETVVPHVEKLDQTQIQNLKQVLSQMTHFHKANRMYFFVTYDCPLCKNYKPLIQMWDDSLSKDSNWEVLVVRVDAPDTLTEMGGETYKYHFTERDHYDAGAQLTNLFCATVTPEVYVLDSNCNLMYYGAIDDWAYETGKHRAKATKHYLNDCIDQMYRGKWPVLDYSKPIGCYIEK